MRNYEDFISKLIDERDALAKRLEHLSSKLKREDFREKIGDVQVGLLTIQKKAMEIYLFALNSRIDSFK